MAEYTHLELDKDVSCFSGFYTPGKEARIKYKDREVLYVVGQAVVETGCCGSGSFGYVTVPGYVVKWQSKINEAGLPVSEVEPVTDEKARGDIRKVLQEIETVACNTANIEFW